MTARAEATPSTPKSKGERRFFKQQPPRIREYETIYILRPNADVAEGERVAARVAEIMARFDATLVKVDNWGRRKLAYLIEKHSRGHFIYLKYLAPRDLVAELERHFRLLDSVIRYQTVKLRDQVDVSAVQVNPEDVAFAPIEAAVEEEEPSLAESLGMTSGRGRQAAANAVTEEDQGEAAADGGAAEATETTDATSQASVDGAANAATPTAEEEQPS